MIINLSFNADFTEEKLLNDPGQKLFDVSGAAAHLSNSEHYVSFRKLPGAAALELEAIDDYLSFIGELSKANLGGVPLRSFQLENLHFYWLLPITVKHDSFHWGQVVFIFLKIASAWPEITGTEKEKLVILLDHDHSGVKSFIKNRLISLGYENRSIEFSSPLRQMKPFSDFIRKSLGLLKAVITTSRSNHMALLQKASNIFVIYGSKPSQDAFLNPYYQLSESLQRSTAYISFDTINLLGLQNSRLKSLVKLLSIYLKLNKLRRQIDSMKNEAMAINGFEFSLDIVKSEFRSLLLRPELFLQYWCFTEVFKKLSPAKRIFFQDEFYPQGRILSAAIAASKNAGIDSYGIQHGLMLRTHTVYSLHESEVSGNHSMPLPNHFVVWGDCFKKLLLNRNKNLQLDIPVAGNLAYILRKDEEKEERITTTELNILWCTTLSYNFKFEVSAVKNELTRLLDEKKVKLKITIRPHPARHLKREEIHAALTFLPEDAYTIENQLSITEQIQAHDVVFAAVYSSVFLDGLVMGKQVVRFNSGIALADFQDLSIPNLNDVNNSEDFRDFIERYLSGNLPTSHSEKLSELCYMKKDRWVKLLTN